MKRDPSGLNETSAIRHLMDLLRIEGGSGQEGEVASALRRKLLAAGCRPSWIRTDTANRRIRDRPRDFETGNLVVRLPGTMPGEPRRMLLAHMDTVPLCRNAAPVRRGRRITARGKTAVRADDRAGVAALVAIAETLLRDDRPRPPLTFLFTIAEEIGLYGAAHARKEDLGRPAFAFNYDGGDPNRLTVGAIGSIHWEAEILGVSAHAGMRPQDGVSAMLIFSRAVADIAARGFFGRIRKGRLSGTGNVGVVQGGEATNQVTDRVIARGECRSHDRAFLDGICREYREAFERAARGVRNRAGRRGRVLFRAREGYRAFRLPSRSPETRFARRVAAGIGLRPKCEVSNGGLDANPLVAAGIPTITLGCGQHNAHSLKEYVDLDQFLAGCRLGLALATAPFARSGRVRAG